MADIAAAAGVSKATVFHHFGNKRGLYQALIADAVIGFREQIVPLLDAEGETESGLGAFAAAHVERLARLRGTMRLIMREMLEGSPGSLEVLRSGEMARNFSLVVEALRRGQAAGKVRADADPGLAAGRAARRAPRRTHSGRPLFRPRRRATARSARESR